MSLYVFLYPEQLMIQKDFSVHDLWPQTQIHTITLSVIDKVTETFTKSIFHKQSNIYLLITFGTKAYRVHLQ